MQVGFKTKIIWSLHYMYKKSLKISNMSSRWKAREIRTSNTSQHHTKNLSKPIKIRINTGLWSSLTPFQYNVGITNWSIWQDKEIKMIKAGKNKWDYFYFQMIWVYIYHKFYPKTCRRDLQFKQCSRMQINLQKRTKRNTIPSTFTLALKKINI